MTARATPRWALSFIDLLLLLLGFFVILHARASTPGAVAAAMRSHFSGETAHAAGYAASVLFEPGEAVLRSAGRARLRALGRQAGPGRVIVRSEGFDPGRGRLDRWELAAARTAAVARALALPEEQVEVAMPALSAAAQGGQRIEVILPPAM